MRQWLLGSDRHTWARRLAARPRPAGGRRWRLLRAALLTALLLLVSVGIATDLFQSMSPGQWLGITWRSLWVASLVVQGIATLFVVISVRAAASGDLLRTTPGGLVLWARSQWLNALLRARVLLLYLVLLRLAMGVLLLVELTAMRGSYLDLIAAFGMADRLPVPVLLVLLSTGLTVALLLPLAALALDAAMGLLAAQALRERTFALTYQIAWLVMRWGSMGASVWLFERVLNREIILAEGMPLWVYAAAALLGDHGASFTSLTGMARVWQELRASPWVAGGGVVLLLAYSSMTSAALWAVRRRLERHD